MDELELTTATLTRAHNDDLVGLFRASPIVADFTVCFDRHPDFFRFPELVFDSFDYRGIFVDQELVGCLMAAQLRGWVGDSAANFCYIGDARVVPEYRGHHIGERVGWDYLSEQLGSDIPLAFGLIKDGNLPAAHVTESTAPDHFEVGKLAPFEASNVLLLDKAPPPRATSVRTATRADIDEIAAVMAESYRGRLFAPVVTAESLAADVDRLPELGIDRYYVAERNRRIVGVIAAWDMGAFKRTLILRYSTMGRILKGSYRAGRLWFRAAAPLPAAGEPFREITMTRMAIPDRDPEILRDLLRVVVNDYLVRGYHMLHVGFAGRDPLIDATEGLFVQRFKSTLYVAWPRDRDASALVRDADPYVDISII